MVQPVTSLVSPQELTTPYVDYLPKQQQFMESIADEVLFSGAFGAGKTRILNEKGLFFSLRYPRNVGLICRKTLVSMHHTTMKSFFEEVCPPNIIANYVKSPIHHVTLINGSEIIFAGLDDQQKLGSLNLGWVGVDEAIETEEPDWIMLLGRLRLNRVPFHQIFAATNPGFPSHYLFNRFFVERKGTFVVQADAFENSHNPPSYIERLSKFHGMYRARYVEGKWLNFEGLIYPTFDPNVHIIEPFDIPDDWLRFGGIDFGFVNPFVFQWWAQDPDSGNLYLYREIYTPYLTVRRHAAIIKEQEDITKLDAIWADHDAEDRATLREEGIVTRPANKGFSMGVQEMTLRLGGYEDVKPSLFIFNNALIEADASLLEKKKPTCTAKEIQSYVWKKPKASGVDIVKEEPRKNDDHGMDTARYVVMGAKNFMPMELITF